MILCNKLVGDFMTNDLEISTIKGFAINANKLNVTKNSPIRVSSPHIHDMCEIYINISGNVSFVVEKKLYDISPGDIIITKPYEYHHCIYNDDTSHEHFWIMFSPHENPLLFEFMLKRKRGTDNLIRISEPKRKKILELCEKLTTYNLSSIATINCFFEIISYIEQGYQNNGALAPNANIPSHVMEIFDFVNKNHKQIKNVNEISLKFGVSVATVERYFKGYLSVTPRKYIESLKLATACKLLRQNHTVTYACFESGFDDFSHFIAKFKKEFKTTPLKYKKHILNQTNEI